MERGNGKTKQQMIDAPPGAIFVWCNSNMEYPRQLAEAIGRLDLELVPPSWISARNIRGREFKGIVIDHATRLSLFDFEVLKFARYSIKKNTLNKEEKIITESYEYTVDGNTRWKCNNKKHRHIGKELADICINKMIAQNNRGKLAKEKNVHRLSVIKNMLENGIVIKDIAKHIGISYERVRQLIILNRL